MARDREIACKSYVCEGNCKKGRGGRFRKDCQTCKDWDPVQGARPARLDLRRKKRADFDKKNRDY